MQRIAAITFIFLILFFVERSSADLIEFQLTGNAGQGLLPGNVTPPTSSTGSGAAGLTGIFYDTAENLLHIDIEWGSENGFSDLTGAVTLLHLHGPTDDLPPDSFSQTGPLMITLSNAPNFDSSATGGGLVGTFFVSNSDVPGLLQGRTYINVHTEMYEMGEIRGYLVQSVPEPGFLPLVLLAVVSLPTRRRRQSQ